jgi:hypothetical protein
MFQPLAIVLAWVAVLIALGAALCFVVAFRDPQLWVLYPILFSGPTFIFAILGEASPPDSTGLTWWRGVAVAFALIPAVAAYCGSARNSRITQVGS